MCTIKKDQVFDHKNWKAWQFTTLSLKKIRDTFSGVHQLTWRYWRLAWGTLSDLGFSLHCANDSLSIFLSSTCSTCAHPKRRSVEHVYMSGENTDNILSENLQVVTMKPLHSSTLWCTRLLEFDVECKFCFDIY